MAEFDYASIASEVAVILGDFGKTVKLRQSPVGTYNPATGANTATSTDKNRLAAIFSMKDGDVFGPGGGLVKGGDKKAIMQAGVIPTLRDKIVDGADIWTILGVKEINPAGTSVAWTLHLRK